jgi:hypothetical protein
MCRLKAGAGEATVHDLRPVLRPSCGRIEGPSAIIVLDRRMERPDT